MGDITVTVTADLPGSFDEEYQEVIHVPPVYQAEDTRMLFAVTVENIGWHALRQAGLPTPLRDAFLGNDAKLQRLEQLVDELERDWSETLPGELLSRLREISLVDAVEAFRRWGGHETEVPEREDPSTNEDPGA